MELLINVLVVLLVAGLTVYIVDAIIPAPYTIPVKVVIAAIVILYLLGAVSVGLHVWRR